jgi:hypothetical protein
VGQQGSNPEVAEDRLATVPEENSHIIEHVSSDEDTEHGVDDEDEAPRRAPG